MKERSKQVIGMLLALSAIGAVLIVEQFIKPGYALKSAAKLACFGTAIIAYSLLSQSLPALAQRSLLIAFLADTRLRK